MTARNPRLLRWTEQAEAEHVRALAILEPEPQSAAAQPKVIPEQRFSALCRPALLPRLLSWFGAPGPQIGRDGDRPGG
ncbi:MAG: hypothetical protein WB678_12110 [Stellaceae bacterium]|jgi:hypothetical protein